MSDYAPIPTMREVQEARGTNGYTMASTFSGCGGACLGYEMAGFDLRFASEFVPAAQEVYRDNHPGVHLDTRDIRDVTASEILSIVGVKRGDLDLLEGSPPCAAFSALGKRDEYWGVERKYSDTAQRVDDLFFEYVRLVKDIQPRVFVAENVPGLAQGVSIGYLRDIHDRLSKCGYKVEAAILDASYLGVAQARRRLFIMGVRDDLVAQHGVKPAFPKPSRKRKTIQEVIDLTDAYLTTDPDTGSNLMVRGKIGKELARTKPGGRSEVYYQVGRPRQNQPAFTFLTSDYAFHPLANRYYTRQEALALCSFPPDFALNCSRRLWVERLGRSVPPLVARAIGETVRDDILARVHGSV